MCVCVSRVSSDSREGVVVCLQKKAKLSSEALWVEINFRIGQWPVKDTGSFSCFFPFLISSKSGFEMCTNLI